MFNGDGDKAARRATAHRFFTQSAAQNFIAWKNFHAKRCSIGAILLQPEETDSPWNSINPPADFRKSERMLIAPRARHLLNVIARQKVCGWLHFGPMPFAVM